MIGAYISLWCRIIGQGGSVDPGPFFYLRPDATSFYLRPDGASRYLRP